MRPTGLSWEGGARGSWAGLAVSILVLSCLWVFFFCFSSMFKNTDASFLTSEVSLTYCALGLLSLPLIIYLLTCGKFVMLFIFKMANFPHHNKK